MRSAEATTSMESAMTSRETRENFMPSWPMAMPSATVMVPNIWPTPPAEVTPALALSANSFKWMLQGVTSLQAEATPTMGFLKSSSWNPTARSMARLGARLSPSVIMEERCFRSIFFKADSL